MNIQANNLTMIYPSGKKALQGISLNMQSPNLIGILGPNGAGKTTLMKLLTTGLIPTNGEILLDGEPLLKQEKKLKRALGYLPQTFGLYDELPVWQFLDYMAALKGIKERHSVRAVIEQTGLSRQRKVKIGALSGGQRQRVGIAQALLGDPKLLILDEPTVGLDPEERVKFRNLFSEMSRNKIVLLSTHIVEDVQSICNRVLVIDNGQILFDGKPDELIAGTQGHVGLYVSDADATLPQGCRLVSKGNTAGGIQCRIVTDKLPEGCRPVEPTLEDAYLYLIQKGTNVV